MTNKWTGILASVLVSMLALLCISACSDKEQRISKFPVKTIDPILQWCEAFECEKPDPADKFIIVNVFPAGSELVSRREKDHYRKSFQERGILDSSRFSIWTSTPQEAGNAQPFVSLEHSYQLADLIADRKKELEDAGTDAAHIRLCICADPYATWRDIAEAIFCAAEARFPEILFVVKDGNTEELVNDKWEVLNLADTVGLLYGGSLEFPEPSSLEGVMAVTLCIHDDGLITHEGICLSETYDQHTYDLYGPRGDERRSIRLPEDLMEFLHGFQEKAKAEGKECAVCINMGFYGSTQAQRVMDVLSALHATGIRRIYWTIITPEPETPESAKAGKSPAPTKASPTIIVAHGTTTAVTAPVTIDSTDGLDLSRDFLYGDGTPHSDVSTLEGTLYDLKQDRRGGRTKVSTNPGDETRAILKEFFGKNWSRGVLTPYYQSKTTLHASYFYMPQLSAEYAPYAFQCPDKVKPHGIVVVYRGKVRAPITGKFRFVGGADDVIAVRFNGQTVLEWGRQLPSEDASNTQEGSASLLGKMQAKGYGQVVRYKKGDIQKKPDAGGFESFCNEVGLIEGSVFTVKEGKTYPIEILIADLDGETFGYFLLIEDVSDSHVTKVKSGAKLYQIFRTNFSTPSQQALLKQVEEDNKHAGKTFNDPKWNNPDLEGPPFDEDSLIWAVVP